MRKENGGENTQDARIIEQLWEREENGLNMLSECYKGQLFCVARSILPEEEAEECVNDTLLAVWNSIPPNRPQYLFAYVAAICRNNAYNRLQWQNARKRRAEVVSLSSELEECIPGAAGAQGHPTDLERLLADFLRGLSKEKRILFVRRYWYGDTIEMLAGRFGYSAGKVKSILFRVRKRCRTYLEKEGVWI